MEKAYKERQAECGLKVRDAVKISRKAEDGEGGWDNYWPKDADTWVGKTGEIIEDGKGSGFIVFCEEENDWWFFPYFVLEKVEEKKLTSYSVFTICDQGEDFFSISATSKKETSESIIFTEESGGVWEFYKKHIVAIKTV